MKTIKNAILLNQHGTNKTVQVSVNDEIDIVINGKSINYRVLLFDRTKVVLNRIDPDKDYLMQVTMSWSELGFYPAPALAIIGGI